MSEYPKLDGDLIIEQRIDPNKVEAKIHDFESLEISKILGQLNMVTSYCVKTQQSFPHLVAMYQDIINERLKLLSIPSIYRESKCHFSSYCTKEQREVPRKI